MPFSREFSIRERLQLELICILIIIAIVFGVLAFFLHSNNSLNALGFIETLASVVTLFGVITSLSHDIINDALNRYENSTKKWIDSLEGYLARIRSIIEAPEHYNPPIRSIEHQYKDANKELANLKRYGRYFLTELYPKKTIKKIEGIFSKLDAFCGTSTELLLKWDSRCMMTFSSSDECESSARINEGLVLSLFTGNVDKEHIKNSYGLWEIAKLVAEENPDLVKRVENLKNEILKYIIPIEKELEDFLRAN